MKTALVLGGNGFLGSHIVDLLVDDGFEVIAFDRFSSGSARYSAKGVTWLQSDYRSPEAIAKAISGQDLVVHAVSATTPARSLGNPKLDVVSDIDPLIDVLERASSTGVGRLVFLSSGGAIYGSLDTPASESTQLLPISPYGIAKLASERFLEYYRIERGLEYTVLRVANPYGIHPQGGIASFGLISALMIATRRGVAATRIGDGSMTRDYLYIEDFCEQFRAVTSAAPSFRVYNCGSGNGHTVNEVIDTVRAVTGLPLPIHEVPTPPSFVNTIRLDCSRMKGEFDLSAATPLRDGISRTWAEFMASQH